LVDQTEVVEGERDRATIAELATHGERTLRRLERLRIVAAQPVQLAHVVDGGGDAALVARVLEEHERRLEVLLRVVETTGVAIEAADACMRSAALGFQVQTIRAHQHLVERVERFVVLAEHLETSP